MIQQSRRNSVAAALAAASLAFAGIAPARAADQEDDTSSRQQYLTDDSGYENSASVVAPDFGYGGPVAAPEHGDTYQEPGLPETPAPARFAR